MDATVEGFLGYLTSQKESKGVSSSKKGVIKDGKGRPDEAKPTLSSPEKSRYTAIFKILKNVLFPPEEAKRLKGTKIDKATGVEKKVAAPGEGKGKSGLPLKLLAGLGIMAAAALLFEALGPVGQFITKAITRIKALGKISQVIGDLVKGVGVFFKNIGGKILGWLGFSGKTAKGGGMLAKGFKMAGGLLKTIFGGIISKIGPKLLKTLKFIPVLGSLVSFGFAIARFKKGETIPAIFEILSGILNLVPLGVTQIISMAIDGGLLLYDMYTAKNEKREEAGMKKIGFLQYFKESIGGKLMTVLEYLPGIGGIISLGKAFGAFKSGNLGEGLKLLGHSLFAFIGGKALGDVALKGIGFITSMFSGEKEEGAESVEKGESFFDIMAKVWKKAGEIVSEKIKALRDWALSKLDPRNWFGGEEEEKKAKAKVQGLSESEKAKRARAAGHSSWNEYKASGWEWKADKKNNMTGDTLKITGDLAKLAKQQLDVLVKINNNIQMLVEKTTTTAPNVLAGQSPMTAPSVNSTPSDAMNQQNTATVNS